MSLLSVRDLRIGFRSEGRIAQAVKGVSFDLEPGEVLALVGNPAPGNR